MHLKITDAPFFVKIPVRLKISVSLKISVRSENPYLKISVRWANSPERCKCSGHLKGLQAAPEKAGTHDHDTTTEGEQESHKGRAGEDAGRRATKKINFALYIGMIAENEKYLQKT